MHSRTIQTPYNAVVNTDIQPLLNRRHGRQRGTVQIRRLLCARYRLCERGVCLRHLLRRRIVERDEPVAPSAQVTYRCALAEGDSRINLEKSALRGLQPAEHERGGISGRRREGGDVEADRERVCGRGGIEESELRGEEGPRVRDVGAAGWMDIYQIYTEADTERSRRTLGLCPPGTSVL